MLAFFSQIVNKNQYNESLVLESRPAILTWYDINSVYSKCFEIAMLHWRESKVSLNPRNNKLKYFFKRRNNKQVIAISTQENLEDKSRSEGKVFIILMDFVLIRKVSKKQLSLTRTIFNLMRFFFF